MNINGVDIQDTFAEAFPMKATRVIITADSPRWAKLAASTMTGFATSVIACGCEASIEKILVPEDTPDGTPRRFDSAVCNGSKRFGQTSRNPVRSMRTHLVNVESLLWH